MCFLTLPAASPAHNLSEQQGAPEQCHKYEDQLFAAIFMYMSKDVILRRHSLHLQPRVSDAVVHALSESLKQLSASAVSDVCQEIACTNMKCGDNLFIIIYVYYIYMYIYPGRQC